MKDDLADRIGKDGDSVSPVVFSILQKTIKPEKVLDPELTGVTPEETVAWLTAFARGVQYVQDVYGTTMEGFDVFNVVSNKQGQERESMIIYDADADFVAVTRRFIADEIKKTRGLGAIFGHSNTGDRHEYTGLELATLLGVEEAYHAYQFKTQRHKYSVEDQQAGMDFNNQNTDDHYESNTLELDAKKAVLKAIADFGFGATHKLCPNSLAQTLPCDIS